MVPDDGNGTTDSGASGYDPNQPVSVLGNFAMPPQWSVGGSPGADSSGDPSRQAPSVFGGAFSPRPWTLADSSLKYFVDPDTMKTIEFDHTAAPETPPWLQSANTTADCQPQPPRPGNAGAAESGSQNTPKSPLTAWPVPGHTELNPRDPNRHQGGGGFGAGRNHGGHLHTGIDITTPIGTPVVAAGDGTVANIQPNPSKDYGNQVVISHGDGLYTQYGHLSRIDVAPGTAVHAGDQIGLSGRSGNVWNGDAHHPPADSHLHFEVRRGSMRPHRTGGQVDDPMQYLPPAP